MPSHTRCRSMIRSVRRNFLRFEDMRLLCRLRTGERLEQSSTAIPAQNRLVVSSTAQLFGLLEVAHSFFKLRGNCLRRTSGPQLRFCVPLMQNAGVVRPCILFLECIEVRRSFVESIFPSAGE